MSWRAVLISVLVAADLAAWAMWVLGKVAENCDNGIPRLECSSFASDVAAPLGILGIVVVVALIAAFAYGRDTKG